MYVCTNGFCLVSVCQIIKHKNIEKHSVYSKNPRYNVETEIRYCGMWGNTNTEQNVSCVFKSFNIDTYKTSNQNILKQHYLWFYKIHLLRVQTRATGHFQLPKMPENRTLKMVMLTEPPHHKHLTPQMKGAGGEAGHVLTQGQGFKFPSIVQT